MILPNKPAILSPNNTCVYPGGRGYRGLRVDGLGVWGLCVPGLRVVGRCVDGLGV